MSKNIMAFTTLTPLSIEEPTCVADMEAPFSACFEPPTRRDASSAGQLAPLQLLVSSTLTLGRLLSQFRVAAS